MSADKFSIRPLAKENLPGVLTIERQSYPSPWTQQQFEEELANPVSTIEVLWCHAQLAGYICYWLIAGELQVLNIATAAKFRRQGVAGHLLNHVFQACKAEELERAWLEVRAGNRAAIELYRKQGFVADTLRAGYYRDGEDALLMVKDFPG